MSFSSKSSFWALIYILILLSGCGRGTPAPTDFASFAKADAIVHPEALEPTPDCDKGCIELRQEFRYVVHLAKELYCYWDEKRADTRIDYEKLAHQLEESITSETDDSLYFTTLRKWAAAFHDGHVNAMVGDKKWPKMEVYSSPVRLEVLAPGTDHEKVIVSATQGTDLRSGDWVTAINGVPASQALDEVETIASGSTRRMRRARANYLVDRIGARDGSEPLRLKVSRLGSEIEVLVPRKAEIYASATGDSKDDTGLKNVTTEILPGGIGYLRIDGFTGNEIASLISQAMQKLRYTQGLLIDLRKNGGGDMSGDSVLSRLISQPITRYIVSPRMSEFLLASRPEYFFYPWKEGNPYAEWRLLTVKPVSESERYLNKPVVALTSWNCFSACDTFVAGLRANGLATIVGEGTGGGTGTPLVFELPRSGNRFRYSVVRGMTAQMQPIEGNGTLPDVLIEPTVEERSQSFDGQLASALLLLRSRMSAAPVEGRPSPELRKFLERTESVGLAPTYLDQLELRRLAGVDEAF